MNSEGRDQGSGVRGQGSEGRGRRSGGRGQGSGVRTRSGMTLVEVILSIAILAILAVLIAGALFYPRFLVVTSAIEQNAIHAGSAAIEGFLHNYTNSPGGVQCDMTGGWSISDASVTVATNKITERIPDPALGPDDCQYLKIKTTITYRDGKQVDLVTYRSLEVVTAPRQLP